MKEKILVTGGTGYVGRNLVRKLVKMGYLTKILVRRPERLPADFKDNEKIEVVEGDINQTDALRLGLKDAYVIFHLAAALNMFDRGKLLYKTNVLGTLNLLNECEACGKPVKIIYTSTIDAVNPVTDYGQSKYECEQIVQKFCQTHPKITYVITRIGNIYGEDGGIIEGIKRMIKHNGLKASLLSYLPAECTLYLIHLDDLTNILVRLIEKNDIRNKVYDLVHEPLNISRLLEILGKEDGLKLPKRRIIFGSQILYLWNLAVRISREDNLLTYLTLCASQRSQHIFNFKEVLMELNYELRNTFAADRF